MADPREQEEQEPTPEQPFDASDPEQVNQRKRDAGRRVKANRQVVRNLLSTPQGRAWLYDVLAGCKVYSTSFIQGDPHATSFNEGQRNVGLRLTAEALAADPKNYLLMLQEKGNG